MTSISSHDLIIAGAGLAGASLALAAAQQGLRVALVESVARPQSQQAGYDERSITLSYGSARIFAGLGLESQISREAVPIRHIHISERGRFGVTRLDSREEHVEALGYVINARRLAGILHTALDALPNVTWLCPARLTAIEPDAGEVRAFIDGNEVPQHISARLVVGADGTDSTVRKLLGIGVVQHDYHQTAIVTQLAGTRPHQYTAYERFTGAGAIALLPIAAERLGLVWMQSRDAARATLALSDADFIAQLQQQFGTRLGQFHSLAPRRAYPLRLSRADTQTHTRSVLIGNAAHALHPIGGQSFNLGLRDIATLAQLLADAHRMGSDIGEATLLDQYTRWRAADQQRVVRFTDTLVRVFESPLPPVAAVRPLGFLAATLCPPLKHSIARNAMGLSGRLPRLARGLPL